MNNYIKKILVGLLLTTYSLCSWSGTIPTSDQVGSENMPKEIAPVCAPFEIIKFVRPTFPDRTMNIKKRGAKQGKLCTQIIQKSIDELSDKGGGTVIIPVGNWLSGRITLKSNINLHLEEGAELHFSGNVKDYLPVVFTRNEGVELYSLGAMIYANGAENIGLTGNGKLFGPQKDCEIYQMHMNEVAIEQLIPTTLSLANRIYDGQEGRSVFLPMFFSPMNCSNVLIEGITFEEPIFWNIVPIYCNNVIIRGITVNSVGTPRGDGIDIDSSRNVLIEYSTLDCGDDCFTIKSGRGDDGLRVNKPSENIVIRYCLAKRGPGGLTCGSETAGMIRNVYVHDCVFESTHNGFYFKTRRTRGGGGENLYFERLRLVSPEIAFRWDMLGSERWVGELANRLPARPVGNLTPLYRHITFKEIIVENCEELINVTGIPELPLSEVSLNNLNAKCKNFINVQDVNGLVIVNSSIRAENAEASIVDGRNIMLINVDLDVPGDKLQTKYSGDLSRPILYNSIANY